MERSLKHMPVLSKKYFHASSPSVFEPYIIGIQSDNHEFSQHDIIHFLEPVHCKGLHHIPIHQIEPVSCIQTSDITI